MLSVQVTAPGELAVREAPDPVRDERAVVAVQRVGICGTDLRILRGAIPVAYPRVMGHEAVGMVEAPGPEGLVEVGQRVLVDPGVWCGRCDVCEADRPHLCPRGGLLGRDVDGVFADRLAVPEHHLVPVPPAIDDEAAGVLQVLGTCVHALRDVPCYPGDVAVVVGLGVSGQLLAQLLRAKGAAVVGVTRSAWKRDIAAALGAVACAPPAQAEAVVADVSRGRGADVVVDAAGAAEALRLAVRLARFGGRVVAFGIDTGDVGPVRPYDLYFKELTVHHPRAARTADYRRGVDLVESGIVQAAPLATHDFPLADAGHAFAALDDPTALKVTMSLS